MADKTITERLQPSLLDRLTDLEPDMTSEGRESRVIDVARLRDIIRRDLTSLLNTNNFETQLDAERHPNAINSVLNYGVREVSGEISTVDRIARIRTSIHQAIERFEPRIKEGTLDVILRKEEGMHRTIVAFDITADMWAQPLPMELYLRSEVDITTGELQLRQDV